MEGKRNTKFQNALLYSNSQVIFTFSQQLLLGHFMNFRFIKVLLNKNIKFLQLKKDQFIFYFVL